MCGTIVRATESVGCSVLARPVYVYPLNRRLPKCLQLLLADCAAASQRGLRRLIAESSAKSLSDHAQRLMVAVSDSFFLTLALELLYITGTLPTWQPSAH